MNKLISDYELIVRFIKGEQACFEKLIHRHKNKVFAYISLYIRDQALAEDIFQDTLLKVIQSVKAGKYSVWFGGDGLSSGVYYYKLNSGSVGIQKVMVLIK